MVQGNIQGITKDSNTITSDINATFGIGLLAYSLKQ